MASDTSDEVLEIPVGDKGYVVTLNYKEKDGVTARSLTSFTGAKFKMWKAGIPTTLTIDGTATIVNPATSGVVTFLLPDTATFAVGTYVGVIQLTASGVIDTSKHFTVIMKESG